MTFCHRITDQRVSLSSKYFFKVFVLYCLMTANFGYAAEEEDREVVERASKILRHISETGERGATARSLASQLGELVQTEVQRGLIARNWKNPPGKIGREAMDDYNDLVDFSRFSNSYEMTFALLYSIEFIFASGSPRNDYTPIDSIKHHPGAYRLVRDRQPQQVREAILEFVRKGEANKVLSEKGKKLLAVIWIAVNESKGVELLKAARDIADKNTDEGKATSTHFDDFINLVHSQPKNDKEN